MTDPSVLEEARRTIEETDAAMAALFERRMQAARTIAAYKAEHGLPVTDAAREEAVLTAGQAAVHNPADRSAFATLLRKEIALSKAAQTEWLGNGYVRCLPTESGFSAIVTKRGSLAELDRYFSLDRKVLIVTDDGVPSRYAQTVANACREAVTVVLPQGEHTKSPDRFRELLDTLSRLEFTRTDAVVAVGGGVVCDLAGFVASAYHRGLPLCLVPTTLLAQIDAAIGGKNAVNLGGIKNVCGTFYPPQTVLIDADLLATLPRRHWRNGLAEAVKMALTHDSELFTLLETGDPFAEIDTVIARCHAIKAAVVTDDEKECDQRRVLNFGHTLGHAIESADPSLLHGECVAIGMVPMCAPAVRKRLLAVLARLELPDSTALSFERLETALLADKKTAGDRLTVVTVPQVGRFCLQTLATESFFAQLRKGTFL